MGLSRPDPDEIDLFTLFQGMDPHVQTSIECILLILLVLGIYGMICLKQAEDRRKRDRRH
jgi:hypothetical protein